ncbi:MAG: Dyp-type peroxidase, partial [Stellaceae bacterium]
KSPCPLTQVPTLIQTFLKDGKDRYGLVAQRPQAIVDLPPFNGDELIETRSGGDLSVQGCADDPQVAFHAVRQLARLAYGVAKMRWAQTGFIPGFDPNETPRNLMGFKDGTSNPSINDPMEMEKRVWVGNEGPDWMRDGSYVVLRRIRIALEHWDRMPLGFQEQTFGRHKYSGAPLSLIIRSPPPDPRHHRLFAGRGVRACLHGTLRPADRREETRCSRLYAIRPEMT